MRSVRRLLPFLAAALWGCSGGDGGGGPVTPGLPDTPVATTVRVTPASVTVELGTPQTFQAQILDQNGRPLSAAVTWTSDMPSSVSVDGQGVALAKAPVVATITAHANGVSGSAVLTGHDGVKPVLSVTSPSDGAEVSGAVPFSMSVSDNHIVSRIALAIDGDTVGTLSPAVSSGTFGLVWDASGATAGMHVASVTAWDPSGNASTATLSVSVNGPQTIACTVYPSDNPWNTDISAYPVKAGSDQYIERLSNTWRLSFAPILPTNVIDRVADGVPMVPIIYDQYGGDPGPMPIPFDAVYQVKDSSKLVLEDNHLVVFERHDCRLYELWSIIGPNPDSSWTAGTGSVFDLTTNVLRPDHTPSSAASGLPVFVGIARADEVRAGAVRHALSIPATLTFEGFIHPATTLQLDDTYQKKLPLVCATPTFPFTDFCAQVTAGTFPLSSPYNAPMGLRLRLKADFDLSGFTGEALILLQAAKTYGLIVTDGSGTAGMMKGEKVSDPEVWNWSNAINKQLAAVPATAFEVVETGPVLH